MIFSESFFVATGWIGGGTAICVYQGVQPTMDEYIANYDSSYNFASLNILKLILKPNADSRIIQDSEDAYTHNTQAIKSFNAGTATWASIHKAQVPGDQSGSGYRAEFSPDGYYFLSDVEVSRIQGSIVYNMNPANNNCTITIVPVSDLSDNGVIKFRSTSFVHPSIDDTDRAIDMSIIGAGPN